MYKIDKLVSYLDRSRPHVVDRIRKKVSSAAAVSIASGSEPSGWSSAKTGYNKIPLNSSLKSTRSLPVVVVDTKVDNSVNFDVPSWESKQPLQRLHQSDPVSPTSSSPNHNNDSESTPHYHFPNLYGQPQNPNHHFSVLPNLSTRGEHTLLEGLQQQQKPVAMGSLRNLELNEKDEETHTIQQRDGDYYERVKDDPKPSSMEENLENIIHLKRALVKSCQKEVPGYLSAEDVRHACAKYSATYRVNLSAGRIQTAISQARSIDPTTGLINVGLFCRFLDNVLVNKEPKQ